MPVFEKSMFTSKIWWSIFYSNKAKNQCTFDVQKILYDNSYMHFQFFIDLKKSPKQKVWTIQKVGKQAE